MRPNRMAHEGFTIFSVKISSAQFDVYRVRFDPCLVRFDFDILSLIKKKNILFDFYLIWFFCLSVSFWFFSLSLISKIYRAWFLTGGVFDFQNERDMHLTNVTASVVGFSNTQGQDTQTYIMAERDREGVAS